MPSIEWNVRWKRDVNAWVKNRRAGAFGDHWGDPETVPELQAVREKYIRPFVRPERTAVEIGSGGGRWTQYLLDFGRLYCVEIHDEMFHYLLERFGPLAKMSFCKTGGTDFPGIPPGSIEYVFSFGTFVHLDPELIDSYLANLRGILAPEANVVIQYADKKKPLAARNKGFAPTTSEVMEELLERNGYRVLLEDQDLLPHSNVVVARPLRA